MKKRYLFAPLLCTVMLTAACAPTVTEQSGSSVRREESSAESESESAAPAGSAKEPEPYEAYMALVERYVEDAVFGQMDGSRVEELIDCMMGHYDIIGRTAGEGRDYYLAIRREDAPVYGEFGDIHLGYYTEAGKNEVFQIGYYGQDSEPHILYELEGYELLELPFGNKGLYGFCFAERRDSDEYGDQAFRLAFTEFGRAQLDYIRKHEGLALYQPDTPCIEFYYQDEDTVTFSSSPYSCFIPVSGEELDSLFSVPETAEVFRSRQEAWNYMREEDGSIRSTGVRLHTDGTQYEFMGSRNSAGYMMSSREESGAIALEYNEDVYGYVMDRIKQVMDIDCGSFDAQWFKVPLRSAEIVFPELVQQEDGVFASEIRRQTVTDGEKLDSLSKLMDRAINSEEVYGFSGCGYNGVITFTRKDGERLRVFIAADSCDSMAYDGRIGFEYGDQAEMAEIFDEAMADRLNQ